MADISIPDDSLPSDIQSAILHPNCWKRRDPDFVLGIVSSLQRVARRKSLTFASLALENAYLHKEISEARRQVSIAKNIQADAEEKRKSAESKSRNIIALYEKNFCLPKGDAFEIDALSDTAIPAYVSGIYFLFCQEMLIYVGQSQNIFGRISAHKTLGILDFETWNYIVYPPESLNEAERAWIKALQPSANRQLVDRDPRQMA